VSNPIRTFALFGGLALASTLVGCSEEVKKENPPAADIKPVTAPAASDLKDMKPADTKPAEVKPVDAPKPVEVKPIDVKPIDVKPIAAPKPAEVKAAEPKLEAPAAPKDAPKTK
jgi:hypothetical protein